MEHEIEITIAYENNVGVKVTEKKDEGDVVIILESDENGHLVHLLPALKKFVQDYAKHILEMVDAEMREE